MNSVRVVGALDRNFAWDGDKLFDDGAFRPGQEPPHKLRGAAAAAERGEDGGWRLLRDPLGINKLFWVQDEDGDVAVAARPRLLVDDGWSFERIRAIPRGCVVDLGSAQRSEPEHSIIPAAWFASDREFNRDIEDSGREIRDLLDRYMAAVAAAYPRAQVFVCLSGGLDSSGIAVLTRRHFPNAVAVSFDVARPGHGASEDRLTAERLARDLKLPLLEATVTEDQLFEKLDTVLVEGIDWRDFNVHAGLVNAALAEVIDQAARSQRQEDSVLVMTGDLANEFLADYHAERYEGDSFYELPRLSISAIRASLVRGLDTSHREIGVFAAWQLATVQPYAAATDAYLAIPENLLAREDRKQQLCRAIFGDLIPDYIYSRPKARAQVGGADIGGGVLAACIDRGFNGAWLQRRFAELHAVENPGALNRFMRAGCYRSGVPSLARDAP